jgi:hypothetical protein
MPDITKALSPGQLLTTCVKHSPDIGTSAMFKIRSFGVDFLQLAQKSLKNKFTSVKSNALSVKFRFRLITSRIKFVHLSSACNPASVRLKHSARSISVKLGHLSAMEIKLTSSNPYTFFVNLNIWSKTLLCTTRMQATQICTLDR